MKRGSKPVNQSRMLEVDSLGAGHRWLARILPPRCLICEGAGLAGLDLCRGCLDDLPRIASPCLQCGLPLPAGEDSSSRCASCLRKPPPFDYTIAPLAYARPVDRLINRFKHQGNLTAGRVLAHVLARLLQQRIDGDPRLRPDCLVPVPLHRWRYWRRGFNQARLLSHDLGSLLKLPVTPVLTRSRHTPHQQGLRATTRRANLKGAFHSRVHENMPFSVALVDDVMTTAATAAECARTLKQTGAESVSVWSIARTPEPG